MTYRNKAEYDQCACHRPNLTHHFGEDLRCENGCGTSWQVHQVNPHQCIPGVLSPVARKRRNAHNEALTNQRKQLASSLSGEKGEACLL